jgi:hypothetical protein
MIDDFAHRERVVASDPNLQVDLHRLYVKALWPIERYLRPHSKSLSDYGGIPFPIEEFRGFKEKGNRFIAQKRSYDLVAVARLRSLSFLIKG